MGFIYKMLDRKSIKFCTKQLITYSFNEKEQTIIDMIAKKENLIYLYEYRGNM